MIITAEKGLIHAAKMDTVLIIECNGSVVNIPLDQVGNVAHVLSELGYIDLMENKKTGCPQSKLDTQENARDERLFKEEAVETACKQTVKKGSFKQVVTQFLGTSKRARGFAAILEHCKTAEELSVAPQLENSLKISIGKLVRSGHLQVSERGRYSLRE